MSYWVHYPPSIVFGWGCRQTLADILPAVTDDFRRYAIICGNSQQRHQVPQELAAAIGVQPAFVFHEISPDPPLAEVDAAVQLLRQQPVALVIGVGGGSAMDVAKAAAAIAVAGGSAKEYFTGQRQITRPGIPFVALPTTAGSGAEITSNAVLTDPVTLAKQSIRHPAMMARAAIVDPELTVTAPPDVTAASGLDALTQAIESYLSRRSTQLSKALAGAAVRLLWPALPRCWADGADRQARSDMAEGSMLGAMAFSHSSLGAVHGLAHPLGSILRLRHGYTCAILLPHILRFNYPEVRQELIELAHITGQRDADALLEAISQRCEQLQIPATFAAHGLHEAHHDFIVANCRSNSMSTNPRDMSDAEVRELLYTLSA